MAVKVPSGYDFCGYATRNDIRCADGVTIRKNAFKDCDGKKVPLVWNHVHNDMTNVIGHGILENREDGVYVYGYLNETPLAENAREQIRHKDISSLSIYANHLTKRGQDVIHGIIREVSLVLAGANEGAFIDWFDLAHSDDDIEDGMGIIYSYDEDSFISHADKKPFEKEDEDDDDDKEESNDSDEEDEDEEESDSDDEDDEDEEDDEKVKHADDSSDEDETVGDILNTLTDKQKAAVWHAFGPSDDDEEEDEDVKHNVFDSETQTGSVLQHSDYQTILTTAKKNNIKLSDAFIAHCESMDLDKDEALAHADADPASRYGIDHIEALFPEHKQLNNTPEWIKRDTTWVPIVMNGVHHIPFSRFKSRFANITEDEARAKGYIKGNMKKEEVFSLLRRSTEPTTVYKKQKLDRDDIIDITDFDVVAWIKAEMRMMLDEELARAILVGDGRLASDEDHIDETHIRPIWKEADLFAVKVTITMKAGATDDDKAKALIRATIKARKYYKGSGSPKMFTTEDNISDMLLLEDGIGHTLYDSEAALATKCRVSSIVPVEIMEGLTDEEQGDLAAIVVNLSDYNVGADKGGAVAMFDDFDIDFNQNKYLIETRCSGALVKPYSALIFSFKQGEGENTVISFSGDGMDEFEIKDEETNG
ncbi:MAG: HK97 family phage prohead protease [Pseudobutyrivibrio sp.]|nr:HK97 family phage prohead protease [Pseudobutyrivibrio sp.]